MGGWKGVWSWGRGLVVLGEVLGFEGVGVGVTWGEGGGFFFLRKLGIYRIHTHAVQERGHTRSTDTHTHAHTHTHTHMYIHTCTYTHTYTYICTYWCVSMNRHKSTSTK